MSVVSKNKLTAHPHLYNLYKSKRVAFVLCSYDWSLLDFTTCSLHLSDTWLYHAFCSYLQHSTWSIKGQKIVILGWNDKSRHDLLFLDFLFSKCLNEEGERKTKFLGSASWKPSVLRHTFFSRLLNHALLSLPTSDQQLSTEVLI